MIREWKKTALLVIDMQKAFVEPGQPLCVAGAQKTVPELIRTVSYVREHGGRIVWIRREYEADGSDMEPFRREKMQTAGTLGVMAKGSYGAQPADGLEGEPGDHFVIKKRFSGFFQTDLKSFLNENKIKTVLITGTQTPNCVRATAFDAVSYDYRTIVIADCTSSANDDVQKSNLQDMRNAGIEICASLLNFR
jgi:nicotinamidase-related amidase